jgi:hypothetical protein
VHSAKSSSGIISGARDEALMKLYYSLVEDEVHKIEKVKKHERATRCNKPPTESSTPAFRQEVHQKAVRSL